jgi:hypothetical protein
MLRLILSLAAVLIVAMPLTSRLSEVRAAGTKPNTGIKSSRGTTTTVEVGTLSGTVSSRHTTASGKHLPKAQLYMRR